MEQRCVHNGCKKLFKDPDEECLYHPGPPEFHEGQKGWKCCKPRVLTFEEFQEIPPCTRGKHSAVNDTPVQNTAKDVPSPQPNSIAKSLADALSAKTSAIQISQPAAPSKLEEPVSDSDDPDFEIPKNATCKRRGCSAKYDLSVPRDAEECVYHPGVPIFHEGSKGYTCCKRRVLEFDQFLKIEGCRKKPHHMYVGKRKKEEADAPRTTTKDDQPLEGKLQPKDVKWYQTSSKVFVEFYIKGIAKDQSTVTFTAEQTMDLDLLTAGNTRYKTSIPLFGPIDTVLSKYEILSKKLEVTLAKAQSDTEDDQSYASWGTLRSDEKGTGERIQVGKARKIL